MICSLQKSTWDESMRAELLAFDKELSETFVKEMEAPASVDRDSPKHSNCNLVIARECGTTHVKKK
jgi:hypothetical protein